MLSLRTLYSLGGKGTEFWLDEIHHLPQASSIFLVLLLIAFSGGLVSEKESLGLSVFQCVWMEHLFLIGGGFPQGEG